MRSAKSSAPREALAFLDAGEHRLRQREQRARAGEGGDGGDAIVEGDEAGLFVVQPLLQRRAAALGADRFARLAALREEHAAIELQADIEIARF